MQIHKKVDVDKNFEHHIYDGLKKKDFYYLSTEGKKLGYLVDYIPAKEDEKLSTFVFEIYKEFESEVFDNIEDKQIKVFQVGGSVRDELLGREPHDKDYVVVGASIEEMLSKGYKQVGKDFPVFIHPKTGEEYALARKEVKIGNKHTDFKFEFGHNVTLEEDLRRRDFVINAIAKNIRTGELIDPFNGQEDIKNKIIRHVDAEHFVEDTLRILRAIRFQCQLEGFTIADETKELLTKMVSDGMLQHLTPERVWKEIEKALQTPNFYLFLQSLDEIGGLQIIFPELYSLKSVPERLEYHPEGNSYAHVLLTLKQVFHQFDCNGLLLEKELDKQGIALVNFGLLCHDLGKALTQETWPAHHDHEFLGLDIINSMCDRLKVPNEYKYFGKLSCKYHMKFYNLLASHTKNQYDMIKQITNFKNWEPMKYLIKVHTCDLMGREGKVAPERIERCHSVVQRIKDIYNIMENKTLNDLPKEVQKNIKRFKGEKFGKMYRDAMIGYLLQNLKRKEQE